MPTGKPRRRSNRLPREQREADILAAALAVFRSRGYEQASISDIAAGAGVVEGLIYRYFKNKRDLLSKVIERWYINLINDPTRIDPAQPIREQLRRVIRAHLQVIRSDPGLSRLVFNEFRTAADYRGSAIHQLNRRYTNPILDIARAAIQSGEFRADVPLALIRDTIFGSIEHHTWAYLRGEGDFSVDESADLITEIVYRGFAAPAERAGAPLTTTVENLNSAVERLNSLLTPTTTTKRPARQLG